MHIDKATLKHIARIAMLKIHDEEKTSKDLSHIISWAEGLNEVNTEGIEPLETMSCEENILAEDKPTPPLSHQQALKNAPKKDSDYFRIPEVKS